tara:strand:- start:106 stop:2169 length:2064 start_codon:yes stop_codon:yes gene_type:complete
MDSTQDLYNALQSQTAEDRIKPTAVLEDIPNETAVYEKDLLQGAGGLMAGSSVEKTFKLLTKSPKGVKVLKKLGMSDEDVETVVDAIKSRDTGALTDFLTRKGTGFVENTAKKLGIKGGKIAKTTVKSLKEGKLPTREELQDSINEGSGKPVNPTKSNLNKSSTEGDGLAGEGEEESQSIFSAIKSKAESSINSVKSSIQDTIGDIPSKIASKVDDIKGLDAKFGRVNKAFDSARSKISGEDDLEGQSSAVQKLLSKSKQGRALLRKNAKAKSDGEPEETPKNPTSEFDEADSQGDYFSQLSKLGKSKLSGLDDAPTEINAITGQKADPLSKIKQIKDKTESDFKKATEQIENEGDRDPYQDIYDKASQDSQRFTPNELGVGKKFEKDIDFKYKAPTREEHLKQLADQEKGKEPMLQTDKDDTDLTDEAFADEEIKPTIPASEQTEGIDPSTLDDDAGFQRGSAKIPAKKEIDPRPEELIEPTVSEPPKSSPEDINDLINKTKIDKPPTEEPQVEPQEARVQEQSTTEEQEIPARTPASQKPNLDPIQEKLEPIQEEEENEPKLTAEQEQPKPPEPEQPKPPEMDSSRPPVPQEQLDPPKQNLNIKDAVEGDGKEVESLGDKVEGGLKGAFEDSLAEDEDPFGIVVSAVLGIGSLIGGVLRKAHHPHFVVPPAMNPNESFSVQEGVA